MRLAVLAAAALLVWGSLASAAFAHAKFLGSKPRPGQTLERAPRTVVLRFDEAIDATFVRLRVQDSAGRRIDRGQPFHPDGREQLLATRLPRRLAGTYVVRYRVLSDDGHPVARRIAFRVRSANPAGERERDEHAGHPPASAQADEPPAEAHEEPVSGEVAEAFAVARGTGYLAMALAIGGVAFLLIVWTPALARVAGAAAGWREASRQFVARLRRIVLGAVVAGVLATALAIVLEGATALGVSFWAALDRDVLDAVADTRVVRWWGVRLLVWLVVGAIVLVTLHPRRAPLLRPAALGADGTALGPAPSPRHVLIVGMALFALAFTAPMAGHAASSSPRGLVVVADALHVLSMSTWLGGLVMLLLAWAVATVALPEPHRIRLLAGVVSRFSRLATVVVGVLLLTGLVQSIVHVASVPALVETGYGRLVLAKAAIFVVLISLGAYNQRRSLPRLRRAAAGGHDAGSASALLRRAVALEVAFALLVLGVTSVLVATAPAAG